MASPNHARNVSQVGGVELFKDSKELLVFAQLIGVPVSEVSDWDLYSGAGFEYRQIDITSKPSLDLHAASVGEALTRLDIKLEGGVTVLWSEREQLSRFADVSEFIKKIDETRRGLGNTDLVFKDRSENILVWINHHGMVYVKKISPDAPEPREESF